MYRPFHFSFRSFVSSVSFSSPFQYIRCTVLQCVIVAALFPKPLPSLPLRESHVCLQAGRIVILCSRRSVCCCTDGTHRCNVGSTYKVTFHALFPVASPARTTTAAGVPLIYKRKGRDRVASPDYIRIIPINTECKRTAFLAETRLARVDNFNRR